MASTDGTAGSGGCPTSLRSRTGTTARMARLNPLGSASYSCGLASRSPHSARSGLRQRPDPYAFEGGGPFMRHVFCLTAALALLLPAIPAQGQTRIVTGRVTDSVTSDPITTGSV